MCAIATSGSENNYNLTTVTYTVKWGEANTTSIRTSYLCQEHLRGEEAFFLPQTKCTWPKT